MTSCEKLILRTARIFPGIRTIIVIFNFTLAFLITLHTAFHGIRSSDFQHKNRLADVALRPNRLLVIIESLFISKQILRNIRSTYFQNKAFSKYVLLVISGVY